MVKNWNEIRPVCKFRQVRNEKNQLELHPSYLVVTPDDEIDRLNAMFTEWKTTKQIEYDKDGMKVSK